MYKKILNFLKYHNLVPILFSVVFLSLSLSLAAVPQVREGIYNKVEKEVGIDNTLLLATNLESWDFQPQILDIEEDEENYYVTYQFKTLGVIDNIWQPTFKKEVLQFSKSALGNRDLADYIAEEIGEVILHEFQVLKDTQKMAKAEGKTQKVKVIEYQGLIGKILNLEPKVIPQENPLIAQNIETPSPTPTLQPTSPSSKLVDEELIRQIVEQILAEKGIQLPLTQTLSAPSQSPTPSQTLEPTSTPQPTPSPEPSQTPTPSPSPTPELSPTPSPTPTLSPQPPPESTPTPTPEPTPTEQPTPTPSPSSTPDLPL
jgi:hypothetical protein